MRNIMCLILGGGVGTRLYPLTKYRSKPAVPVAGKYRLIDIPISNCLNSNMNRIYLLTQFNSVSLHRHIRQTYKFDSFSGGFVEILAAQQTLEAADWYQGTADAVRKNLRYVEQPGIEYVFILSGDQLYRMDLNDMLETHRGAKADVTISTVPVSSEEAAAFGIMRIDAAGRVVGFLEKPKTEDELKLVRTDPAWLDAHGIESRGRDCLASMGIYLFNRDTLVDLLRKSDYQDFGREVFPMAIRTRRAQTYAFDGYWEDIGTIKSFYEANLALAGQNPPFEFHAPQSPIYTRARYLPPTRIEGATIRNSLVADGCVIGEGAVIENSVIGLRCHVGPGAVLRNTVVMGMDAYQNTDELAADRVAGRPHIGIGAKSQIDGAIIDKNCRIGSGVRVKNECDTKEREDEYVIIREGIVIIPRDGLLPDGWSL